MAKKIEFSDINQFNANVALKNRLYVSGFLLSGLLVKIRNGQYPNCRVIIHYENDVPVGVALHAPKNTYQVQIFVKKSFRKRGIGSKMLLQLDAPKDSRVGTGSEFSAEFWRKNQFRAHRGFLFHNWD